METTINISLSKKLDERLSEWAKRLKRTKAEILREAVLAKIDYLEDKYLGINVKISR